MKSSNSPEIRLSFAGETDDKGAVKWSALADFAPLVLIRASTLSALAGVSSLSAPFWLACRNGDIEGSSTLPAAINGITHRRAGYG